MPPTEPKTLQSRNPAFAGSIGWTFVSREEAVERRCGIPDPFGRGGRGQECPRSFIFGEEEAEGGFRPRIPSPETIIARNKAPAK
jgi:hypothetical protein